MWDEDIEGTSEDDELQAKLVAELDDRGGRLLNRLGKTMPVNYGAGFLKRVIIGDVDIKYEDGRGMWIDVFTDAYGERRAYTENLFINRGLVTDYVLPILRKAMILDDIIDAGGSDG